MAKIEKQRLFFFFIFIQRYTNIGVFGLSTSTQLGSLKIIYKTSLSLKQNIQNQIIEFLSSQVIGSVTTYLVILIQVGDLPTGNPDRPPNTTIRTDESNFTMITDAFTTIASP